MIPRFNLTAATLFAIFAGALIYGSLLFRAVPLERDDLQLISPLVGIHGPAEYFNAWRAGTILDVAPVRDLTFLADLKLSALLNAPTYTATNFALWIVFVVIALKIFMTLGFEDGAMWALLLVLVCHPAYAVSVAWIASRKHLLAGIFCLAATLSVIKPPRKGARAWPLTWYVLSVFSHPIQLLWPLWVLCYSRAAKKTMGLLITMLALASLEAWYYTGPFVAASGGLGKFSSGATMADSVLAAGRAILNLVFPVALSPVDYFPASPLNVAGLLLLPCLIVAALKFVPRRKLLTWSVFFVLPLLLVNIHGTRVFLSDTYLLIPSIGLWILLAEMARGLKRMPALAGAAVLAPAGLWATRTIAVSFASMNALFSLAYAREATPQVSYVHATHLFESGQLREAAEISYAAIPDFPPAETLFAQAVTSDDQLNANQKLELLEKVRGHEPFFHFFLAETLGKAGHPREAFAEISPGLSNLSLFGPQAARVAASGLHMAEQAGAYTPALEANLGEQLMRLGQFDAFRAFRKGGVR
ncbi:MAG: hypothetical protein ACXVB9_02910 [Bdellovibrionota bacterium]